MKQLLKIAKKITILVLAISLFGCTDDDATLPKVVAGFTYTLNADTGTVTFINISTQATNYSWDFGDDTSSSLINPVKTYPPGEYKVILKATNVAGASDTFEDIIVISDIGAPIITLLGNTTINILVGGTFTDPGATATDDEDGDITANIVVGGDTVDVNTAGTYIITYNVSDAAGNAATQRTRTVIVSEEVIEPCVAENTESNSAADLNITFLTDDLTVIEDGASFERIPNPDFENDVNGSCFVGKVTKLGNNPWDNNQIDLDAKLDFNANAGLKIKVWSGRANTEVRIKLEEIGNPGNNVELPLTTTVTSAWEELTFPFSSTDSGKFNKIVIFFDLNANNTDTYYFDDLKLYVGDGGGGICTAETAESLNAADFNLTFKTDQTANITPDNATFAWISNPDFDNAVNPSCKVGQYVRNPDELYPNHQINFTTPLSFTNSAGFKLKVWTPTVGTNVTVKLEGSTIAEVSKTTTVANAWEELTFEFGDNASGNTKIVLFFNVGTNTPGTFYYDDFKLYPRDGGGNPPGDCPVPTVGEFIVDGDFEANAGCWELIDNGGMVTISTTTSNGGSNSGQIKTAPLKNPALKQTRFGVGSILPNTTYVVKFDIKSSSPLVDGAVFQAFTFSEPADGSGLPAAQHILIAGDPSVTASWVTRTYEFITAANVDGGLSLLFELVCGGAGTCDGTVNIDNVSLKLK